MASCFVQAGLNFQKPLQRDFGFVPTVPTVDSVARDAPHRLPEFGSSRRDQTKPNTRPDHFWPSITRKEQILRTQAESLPNGDPRLNLRQKRKTVDRGFALSSDAVDRAGLVNNSLKQSPLRLGSVPFEQVDATMLNRNGCCKGISSPVADTGHYRRVG